VLKDFGGFQTGENHTIVLRKGGKDHWVGGTRMINFLKGDRSADQEFFLPHRGGGLGWGTFGKGG